MDKYTPKHRANTQDTPGFGERLFPPRRVPSFAEVVGPEAAADYTRIREDLDVQELTNRRQSRAAHRLGLCSVDNLLTPAEQVELEKDITSLNRARISTQEDLDIVLE
jgi:hypothetical protein